MPTASLQRGKSPPTNKSPEYDTKPSGCEAFVLEVWQMWSTS